MKKFIILLFFFSLIICGCSNKNSNTNLEIEDEQILVTTYKQKPSTGRPRSQEPIDNIFIALNELKIAGSYESTSVGSVKAKKGSLTLATQKVQNKKIVTQEATFSESISTSTFVKVAEQIYIKENIFLKREAKKVSSSGISWNDNVSKLTEEQYLNTYGYSPKDPTRYIINKNTIISEIETTNNGIGRKYSYKFSLDPELASYFYKSSVKELSGSSNDPKFKSIELEITLDYKWRITQIVANEIYDIEIPALGQVTCHATLTETFKNINRSTTIGEEIFFKKHL